MSESKWRQLQELPKYPVGTIWRYDAERNVYEAETEPSVGGAYVLPLNMVTVGAYFEAIPDKPKHWTPSDGDRFWFVDEDLGVDSYYYEAEDGTYRDMITAGNCFKTKSQAIAAAEAIRALLYGITEPDSAAAAANESELDELIAKARALVQEATR